MKKQTWSLLGQLLVSVLLACGLDRHLGCPSARGNEQILRSFSSTDNAARPLGSLVQDANGVLYGITQGGAGGAGTVFAIDPDGTGFRVLHNFGSSANDATNIAGSLLLGADGALYGVSGGGSNGMGAIFRLHTDGGGYQLLYSFGSVPQDGTGPQAPLVQAADGTLYGVTYSGGASNQGVVFELNPDGSAYRLLHSFVGGPSDGANPQAGLMLSNGSLYGTTWAGGTSALRAGTVFKLRVDGSGFMLLHSFNGSVDGASPYGALIVGRDGALYGTTTGSGYSTGGNVFRLSPDGSAYRVLYTFYSSSQFGVPQGSLLQTVDGILYGITTASQAKGSAFKLNPDGTGFAVVHAFGSFTGDGWRVNGLLLGTDGAMYGTTLYGGGALQLGTVFRLTELPAAPPFIISLTPLAGGSFHISFEGIVGANYSVDSSTDLSNWVTLGTVSNETGGVQFLDWNAANAPQRFYRATLLP